MSYYKTCPHCGAHLDPCEVCECKEEAAPGTRNTKAANRTDCNHTIYHYRYYRR